MLKKIELNIKQLHSLAKKLVSFKSVTPKDDGCIGYIESLLKPAEFVVYRLDRNGTSNLFAIRRGNTDASAPTFAFAGHIDVVPPGNKEKWSFDPYTLTAHDHKLYGRGIADMKGSVAAFITASLEFTKEHPNANIALIITSDEEGGAQDGTIAIVEYLKKNNIHLEYCILGEPSSVKQLGDVVKVGRRGSLNCELEIIGTQGHIAYPDLAQNPIHIFAPILAELTNTVWDGGNEYFPASSLQFSNINSGLGVTNVIPGELYTTFNIRYNNLHTAESLQAKIGKTLDKYPLKYNATWKCSAKPFLTQNGKLTQIVTEVVQETLNITPELKTDGGTSDGRFLIDVCHEIIELGHVNHSIHQINEHIPEHDLQNLTNTYYNILCRTMIND